MRVLLDECLPRQLKADLVGHEVRTVPEMSWAGTDNGDLLRLAAAAFDVFLTVDRNISHQRALGTLDLAVIVLVARSNRLLDLRPLIPAVLDLLPGMVPGQVIRVSA